MEQAFAFHQPEILMKAGKLRPTVLKIKMQYLLQVKVNKQV
jgi:hypothetical protein